MFENAKNVRRIDLRKKNGLTIPAGELLDIPMEEWNAMARRSRIITCTINSREVAGMVGKNHFDLLRDIKTYIRYLGESNFAFTEFFIESSYLSSQNKQLLCYEITKMGCEMIANKLTGKKGVLFTAAYVKRFNEMEADTINEAVQITDSSLINKMDKLMGLLERQM